MFGWFDRKHLGWLARFMKRVPVFPIPGTGRYMRQPLYALDFCDVIVACLRSRREGAWNTPGRAQIGSAACRESVGRYGSISVAAASLQQKVSHSKRLHEANND